MIPRLTVDIEKRLDRFRLRVALEVNTEIMVLFGPSGAGKTMTLRSIAGLVSPDDGEIVIDGRTLFRKGRPGRAVSVPARKRGVGYVFQEYALFPHLTALDNVAYPLWRRPGARAQALALLERMRLEHLVDRYPRELSGGQQQRVAIARALAAEPDILLLDEPFAALDPVLRERLQSGLRDLQREFGLVVILVTHNIEDAFAVGDRLAVVHDGEVTQVGSVDQVLGGRETVARVRETAMANLFEARVVEATADGVFLDWDGLAIEAPPQHVEVGGTIPAYIRPEDIKVLYPDRAVGAALRHNPAEGTILARESHAGFTTLRAALPNGGEVEIRFPDYTYERLPLEPGTPVRLSLRREGVVLLHGPGGGYSG